ncbi:hypothetical protein RHMOL_Rhmol07G0178600 [Rhododendron molle]|uniref:Uncharacterized protein n=1 Tax=Rhododendron molle TaxID=49168 RepID=A0ACC0N2Y9_RHOML|nr:hypothetical protein RHMOL_Rhmol07G0178600 [Rhododendron molle]
MLGCPSSPDADVAAPSFMPDGESKINDCSGSSFMIRESCNILFDELLLLFLLRSRRRRGKKSVSLCSDDSVVHRCTVNKAATLVSVAQRRRWSLCSDDESRPSSLEEFLQVEQRFGDVALFGVSDAELKGSGGRTRVGGMLFIDEKLLPSRHAEEEATYSNEER